VILNNFDDEYLVDTAKDLGIELASDREGCLVQISVIKAEEKLRADLAEASYLAHLNKLKERDQEVGELDLAIIDNSYRGLSSTSDSNQEISSKKWRIRRGWRRRKDENHVMEHEGFSEACQKSSSQGLYQRWKAR
jgi:hypothetical protein